MFVVYHCGGLIDNFPCFYWGRDFLGGSLAVPGGAIEYVCVLHKLFLLFLAWCGGATGQAALYACADCVVHALRAHLRGGGFSVRSCCLPSTLNTDSPF